MMMIMSDGGDRPESLFYGRDECAGWPNGMDTFLRATEMAT